MQQESTDLNQIKLTGTVAESLELSHSMFGEQFYKTRLSVPRLSGAYDLVPVTVSERLLALMNVTQGDDITVMGQLRSYNHMVEGHNRLIITAFASHISPVTDEDENPNRVLLKGYICRKPVFRTTPFGREITDMLVAVNRMYNKSDYIPVIAWGRNARFAQSLDVGGKIGIEGRLQSRVYQKKLSEDVSEDRTAYEVSVSSIETLRDDANESREPDLREYEEDSIF